MKTLNLSILVLAAGAVSVLSSCQKEPQTQPVTDEGVKSVALTLNLGSPSATKAQNEVEDPYANGFDDFENIAILFTDQDGVIKYAFQAESSDQSQDTDAGTIWDHLYDGTGVRFIGLENISQIYVVANIPADAMTFPEDGIMTQTVNVTDINDDIALVDYFNLEQIKVPYIGADLAFEQLDAASVTGDAKVVVGEDAGQYYKAEISIRPAISRFEVSKVTVVNGGTAYFKLADSGVELESVETDAEADYKVEWSGFNPSLVGVYMSNFYTNTAYFPAAKTTLEGRWTAFETPSFENETSPITQGLWSSAALDGTLNDLVSYSNYTSSDYGLLFDDTYSDVSGGTLFDGSKNGKNKVIPFNFFVPYDLRATGVTDVYATDGSLTPKIHFQFKEGGQISTTISVKNTSGGWKTLDSDSDQYVQLNTMLAWPSVPGGEDGIAFANVTFVTDQNNPEGSVLKLRPGFIYKVQEVKVSPVNISGSVTSSDLSNIFVTVTVVPFNTENVYPVFD